MRQCVTSHVSQMLVPFNGIEIALARSRSRTHFRRLSQDQFKMQNASSSGSEAQDQLENRLDFGAATKAGAY